MQADAQNKNASWQVLGNKQYGSAIAGMLLNSQKGDLPQLTIRSALTGMILGGILSLTNIYVGIKTGWGLGVGITSVIISYAAFKLLSRAGTVGAEWTIYA